MHLYVPSYTFPNESEASQNVLVAVSYIGADILSMGSGRSPVYIYRGLFSFSQKTNPAQVLEVELGERWVVDQNSFEVISRMPNLEEIKTLATTLDNEDESLDPFSAIELAILQSLMNHPKFPGSSVVMSDEVAGP